MAHDACGVAEDFVGDGTAFYEDGFLFHEVDEGRVFVEGEGVAETASAEEAVGVRVSVCSLRSERVEESGVLGVASIGACLEMGWSRRALLAINLHGIEKVFVCLVAVTDTFACAVGNGGQSTSLRGVSEC